MPLHIGIPSTKFFRRIFRSRPAKPHRVRPWGEPLESRQLLTVSMAYVNDNWNTVTDNGAPGISVGDVVNNANDAGSAPVTAVYGVDAFGVITTGSSAGSLAGSTTINNALAETNVGGTTRILAGNYTELVNLTQSVTLEGENAGINPNTTVRAPESVFTGAASGIRVQGSVNNITIDGLKFTGSSGATGGNERTVILLDGFTHTNVTIKNNLMDGILGHGVFQNFDTGFTNLNIQDNRMVNTTVGSQHSGIKLQLPGGSGGQISGNYISGTTDSGIIVNQVTDFSILNNTIEHVPVNGINLALGSQVLVQGNTVNFANESNSINLTSHGGIRVRDSDVVAQIIDNVVTNSFNGLAVNGGTTATITVDNLQLTDNTTGIRIQDGGAATIGNTTITGGTTGMRVDGAASSFALGNGAPPIEFIGQSGDYITLSNSAMDNTTTDISSVRFDGYTPGLDPISIPGLLAIENKLFHEPDNASLGLLDLLEGPGVVVGGTPIDDLLIITATGPDSGTWQLIVDWINAPVPGPVVPFAGITHVLFFGMAGNDRLRIQNPAGTVLAPSTGIIYDGGINSGVGDSLEVYDGGGGGFATTSLVGPTNYAGSLTTTDGNVTQQVLYDTLERAFDASTAATLTIRGTDAEDIVSISNESLLSPPLAPLSGPTYLQVGITGYAPLEFKNKVSATINTGITAADVGDQVTVNYTSAPTGLASLLVNSLTGADTVTIDGTGPVGVQIAGGLGNDVYQVNLGFIGGTVTLTDPVSGGFDRLTVQGTSNAESFHINDLVDNQLQVTGNAGTEIVDYSNQQIEDLTFNGGTGNEQFFVKPAQVVAGVNTEIHINGQSPIYTEPFTPGGSPDGPGDQLSLVVPTGGEFTIIGNVIEFEAPAAYTSASYNSTIDFFSIETLHLNVPPLPNDATSVRSFDFNANALGNTTGYTSVLSNDLYDAGNTTFGWDSAVGVFERSGPNSLLFDGHFFHRNGISDTAAKTFSADLGYDGYYLVSVTSGDQQTAHDNMRVTAEGKVVFEGVGSDASSFFQNNFIVKVDDGTLNMVFEDIHPGPIGNADWVINALEIRPAVLLSLGLLPYTTSNQLITVPVAGDGASIDTITGVNATPNALITITSSLGTILTADADPLDYAGVQVQANASGNFSFTVLRPNGVGASVIDAREVTGAKSGMATIDYDGVSLRRFDFNAQGSPTQTPVQSLGNATGYIGVEPTDLYSDAQGYGWQTAVGEVDQSGVTGAQAELRTDFHFEQDLSTFRVKLTNGDYFVHLTMGDKLIAHENMRVTAENLSTLFGADGAASFDDIDTSANQWFHDGFTVTVSDGILDLRIEDVGAGNQDWVINGLEIRPMSSVLGQITLTGSPSGAADGGTDTYTGSGATPNALVTITTTMGTITSADANGFYKGKQVQADASGNFTFTLSRPAFFDPTEPGGLPTQNVVLEALEIDGARDGVLPVTYTPVPHAATPLLSVTPGSGNEDAAFNLAARISAALQDTDGSETLSIGISGVPTGASLSVGTPNGGGNWTLTAAQAAVVTLTPPLHSDADFTLTVSAQSTESGPPVSQSAIVSANLGVTINAVADAPTLSVLPASGNVDTAIPLTISAGLVDTDGSEALSIILSSATIFTLNQGIQQSPGVWKLTPAQLTNLKLTPPANSDADFTVTVTARATESSNGNFADTTSNLDVTVMRAFRYDFNNGTAITELNYIPVGPLTTYGAGGSPTFGWVSPSGIGAVDRGAGTPSGPTGQVSVLRDLQYGPTNDYLANNSELNARTFRVSGLLASTAYAVTATIGDKILARPDIQISAGGPSPPVVVSNVSTALNEFKHVTFTATTDGAGNMYVKIKKTSGYGTWVLNGLDFREAQSPLALSGPAGPFTADQFQTDTFAGTGANPNAYVSITTTLGTVVSTDTHIGFAGVQSQADANGNFSFAIKRPGSIGTATITAEEVTGAAIGTITRNYDATAAVRRLDFNAPSSPTQAGFLPVRATPLYSATAGYGWSTSGVLEIDRSTPTALRRDNHYAAGTTPYTFSIAVTPGKQYQLRFYSGDQNNHRNTTYTIEGGGVVGPIATSPAGYNTTVSGVTAVSAASDGILTVVVQSIAGKSFAVNGIDIWESTESAPVAETLQVAGLPLAQAPVVSNDALAPIVTAAIDRWAAAGITPEQLALLRSVEFQVTPLASGQLGQHVPGRILIDDDAQGYGWYVDESPATDEEYQEHSGAHLAIPGTLASQMDLLTVVMHELGHELGLHDLDADGAAASLMTEVLAAGARQVPSADAAWRVDGFFADWES